MLTLSSQVRAVQVHCQKIIRHAAKHMELRDYCNDSVFTRHGVAQYSQLILKNKIWAKSGHSVAFLGAKGGPRSSDLVQLECLEITMCLGQQKLLFVFTWTYCKA